MSAGLVQRRGARRPDGTDLIGAWTRSPVTDLSPARPVRPFRQISPNGGANPSMTTASASVTVIGGVDTHKHTHYAAAVDDQGRLLGRREFPANDHGYQDLLEWMRGHGDVVAIGVESAGSFGATLTRALTKAGIQVVEVNRPNRLARRMDGKSDQLDAEQIARAVLGRTSTAIPKAKSGAVEVIRTLRVTRASAVKSRTQAFNTLSGVIIGAPSS